ncbi:MAG TPA: SGNH/GDSL hydrolase family protein, partial [Candidatus Saccharibacteria bacterium]|nr:SGNH/GDSL hydrolase family protein [Candidatus Saccharibacteria bacterium]
QQVSFAVQTKDGVKWQIRVSTSENAFTNKVMLLGLGDSFSSGEGELDDAWYQAHTNTAPDMCHTSVRSYPYLIGQFFGLANSSVFSVACSGATSHDILSGQDYMGQGGRLSDMSEDEQAVAREQARTQFIPGRIPQLQFVAQAQPAVVTVGVGGNDAGFMKKLAACAMPSTCDWAQPGERRVQVLQELQALYPRFIEVYQRIAQASPLSKIYAIGYPRIIETEGTCDAITGVLFDRAEREFMVEAIGYLNEVMSAAAYTAGVEFVDFTEAFHGATLCSEDPEAMNGFRVGDDMSFAGISLLKIIGNESFHPTPVGHVRIASRFTADFPDAITEPQCQVGETRCAVLTPLPLPSPYWGEAT